MANPTKENTGVYIFLLIAMLIWGLSFVWYKQALVYLGPISLVLGRLIVSFPLLILAAVLLKRLKKISRRDYPLFLLLAFMEPFLYFIGESNGLIYLSSTVAAIIIATIPIFTVIFTYLFLQEKLSISNYLGIVVSFAGVVLVILADKENMQATYKGLLFMGLAVFAAVGYGLLVHRIAARYNPLTIVSAQNAIATIYFLPVYLIFEHKQMMETQLTFEKLLPMLYLAIFASAIGYLGFIQGLRKLGVSKATVFTNFIPVFTAIFAYFILGDRLSVVKVAGIILVILGLILSQRKKKAQKVTVVNELY